MNNRIGKICKDVKPLDEKLLQETQKRLNNLTKPVGSLGYLEDIAKQFVAITGEEEPSLKNKIIFTLAADHGVTEEGISAYPEEVTAQMVANFLQGGAAINVLANHIGAEVVVVDMGVKEKLKIENKKPITRTKLGAWANMKNFKDKKINFGTKNMVKDSAMTRKEAVKSIEAGITIFKEQYKKKRIDIVGIGDMGIGNTTSSSAIASVITGKPVEDMVGRGTGIDDTRLANKIKIVKKALSVNKPNPNDPMDVLHKVGGFEIGGLVGVILSAASHRVPVVLDGFITGASALIAYKLEPEIKNYMFASHCSVERGHKVILDYIGLKPMFNLNLRLGEGTGSALGISLIEAGVKILTQMATFKEAGVSERK